MSPPSTIARYVPFQGSHEVCRYCMASFLRPIAMPAAMRAYVWAQPGVSCFDILREEFNTDISDMVYYDFSFTIAGITITNEVELSGYEGPYGLFPVDGEQQHYRQVFTMEITG